ncbi:MAG: hypothetical protein HZA54_05955 [Planctomycetes bacterium]|nr:hypothetical protein [Planctomycetota bacterium]
MHLDRTGHTQRIHRLRRARISYLVSRTRTRTRTRTPRAFEYEYEYEIRDTTEAKSPMRAGGTVGMQVRTCTRRPASPVGRPIGGLFPCR